MNLLLIEFTIILQVTTRFECNSDVTLIYLRT